MDLFQGIENASNSDRLPRLSYGRQRIRIDRMKGISLQAGNGTALIVDFTVLESNNKEDPPGATRSYYQGISKFTLGYVKNFAAACLGIDPRDTEKVAKEVNPIVKKALDAAIGTEQIFTNVELIVQVDPKEDKEVKGKFHANHVFYPVEAKVEAA